MTLYTELLSEDASDGRRLVHVERDHIRAVVTLCDPERLNPLSAGGARAAAAVANPRGRGSSCAPQNCPVADPYFCL
jgi:hypothetical protein